MLTILIYVLVLWGIIALAWLVSWWLKRRGAAMSGQFTNIVLFVGFLFGFLLTTLQVFATNHYSDARSQAQSEPTSLVTMYDDLGVFPPRVRTAGHRVIICYMWSVAEGDWKAQEREDSQESPDTVAWGDRLRDFRNKLPPDSPATQQVGADLSNADSGASSCCSWPVPKYRRSCGLSCSSVAACCFSCRSATPRRNERSSGAQC